MAATTRVLHLAVAVAASAAWPAVAAAPSCGQAGTCPSGQEQVLLQTKKHRSSVEVLRYQELDKSEDAPLGFPHTGNKKAAGLWCEVDTPPEDWHLKTCPFSSSAPQTTVKVLTYNLFWWNLFRDHNGGDRSAGKLIARTAGDHGYDLMGFQECDDRHRVLRDALEEGLQGDWEALDGGHALGLMYRRDRFELLSQGKEDVGEDDHHQWYGKRSAVWVRLRHVDGTVVFYINHHGPLPVSWGGGCTGSATSYNILRVIAENSHHGDAIILTGDFNAELGSSRVQELSRRLNRVHSGTTMGGVDHIFSNCKDNVQTANLGKGVGEHGSDHDALSATFHFR